MARYSKGSHKTVGSAIHRMKEGTLKSGTKGGRVKSRKQAIAIGLSEARKKGEKVPSARKAASAGGRRKAAKAGVPRSRKSGAAGVSRSRKSATARVSRGRKVAAARSSRSRKAA